LGFEVSVPSDTFLLVLTRSQRRSGVARRPDCAHKPQDARAPSAHWAPRSRFSRHGANTALAIPCAPRAAADHTRDAGPRDDGARSAQYVCEEARAFSAHAGAVWFRQQRGAAGAIDLVGVEGRAGLDVRRRGDWRRRGCWAAAAVGAPTAGISRAAAITGPPALCRIRWARTWASTWERAWGAPPLRVAGPCVFAWDYLDVVTFCILPICERSSCRLRAAVACAPARRVELDGGSAAVPERRGAVRVWSACFRAAVWWGWRRRRAARRDGRVLCDVGTGAGLCATATARTSRTWAAWPWT
jgi:hypothetical protein